MVQDSTVHVHSYTPVEGGGGSGQAVVGSVELVLEVLHLRKLLQPPLQLHTPPLCGGGGGGGGDVIVSRLLDTVSALISMANTQQTIVCKALQYCTCMYMYNIAHAKI